MLQVENGKVDESLNIRLIPNHDRNEENIRFATVDVARARTMTGSLVSSQFPREANRVIGGRHRGELLERDHGRGVDLKITSFNLLIQRISNVSGVTFRS